MPRATTAEYHLKPVVLHRNKKWQPPHDDHHAVNDGFYVRNAPCGTEWRHCPVRWDCNDMGNECPYHCERIPTLPNAVLPERLFEDIDLATGSKELRLIIDRGYLRFVRMPRTDRDLLIAYEKEYSKTEKSHILGNYQNLLTKMLIERGYTADIHDVRQRLH
jgi:hypothetical protein